MSLLVSDNSQVIFPFDLTMSVSRHFDAIYGSIPSTDMLSEMKAFFSEYAEKAVESGHMTRTNADEELEKINAWIDSAGGKAIFDNGGLVVVEAYYVLKGIEQNPNLADRNYLVTPEGRDELSSIIQELDKGFAKIVSSEEYEINRLANAKSDLEIREALTRLSGSEGLDQVVLSDYFYTVLQGKDSSLSFLRETPYQAQQLLEALQKAEDLSNSSRVDGILEEVMDDINQVLTFSSAEVKSGLKAR